MSRDCLHPSIAKVTVTVAQCLPVWLFLLAALPVCAQQLSLRHYDVPDGLAHSQVVAIRQDRKGYLWFSTWEGLSRFYGYRFTNYGVHDGRVLVAMGRVFVTGRISPGRLYIIDPSRPAGAVTTVSSGLGDAPYGIAFDGRPLWTANGGLVSIITAGTPFRVTNIGFIVGLGIVYDGANIWLAQLGTPGYLKKLDANGAFIATATVGDNPFFSGLRRHQHLGAERQLQLDERGAALGRSCARPPHGQRVGFPTLRRLRRAAGSGD